MCLAICGEVWQVLCHAIAQMHSIVFDENHVGDCGGEDLRIRLQVEKCVLCHSILANLAHSKGPMKHRLSMSRHQDDCSRDQPAINSVLQANGHIVEASLRHAYLGGGSITQGTNLAAFGVGKSRRFTF